MTSVHESDKWTLNYTRKLPKKEQTVYDVWSSFGLPTLYVDYQ